MADPVGQLCDAAYAGRVDECRAIVGRNRGSLDINTLNPDVRRSPAIVPIALMLFVLFTQLLLRSFIIAECCLVQCSASCLL